MSYSMMCHITCDICSDREYHTLADDIEQAREIATDEGWRCVEGEEDICPDCRISI